MSSATAAGIGVVADPCAGVPITPTAAHKATSDWYGSWMQEWLGADWGQRCRYHGENALLPKASARRVVFLGDSITEGWKEQVPSFFSADVLDRGIGGQTTEQMLVRVQADVLDLHPAVVHIMAGTNDVAGNRGPTTVAQIESNLQSLIDQSRHAHIRVVIGSIPPAARFSWSPVEHVPDTIRTINAWLRNYADHNGLVYVDYYSALADAEGGLRHEYSEDGVHPNLDGYAVMQPLAQAAIDRALAQGRARAR
jgi:lysophospholipase L1-like esterase